MRPLFLTLIASSSQTILCRNKTTGMHSSFKKMAGACIAVMLHVHHGHLAVGVRLGLVRHRALRRNSLAALPWRNRRHPCRWPPRWILQSPPRLAEHHLDVDVPAHADMCRYANQA